MLVLLVLYKMLAFYIIPFYLLSSYIRGISVLRGCVEFEMYIYN
jgi:hypothetical protein